MLFSLGTILIKSDSLPLGRWTKQVTKEVMIHLILNSPTVWWQHSQKSEAIGVLTQTSATLTALYYSKYRTVWSENYQWRRTGKGFLGASSKMNAVTWIRCLFSWRINLLSIIQTSIQQIFKNFLYKTCFVRHYGEYMTIIT